MTSIFAIELRAYTETDEPNPLHIYPSIYRIVVPFSLFHSALFCGSNTLEHRICCYYLLNISRDYLI